MARNLEFKVRCDEEALVEVRSRAKAMGVTDFEELMQTDTYFAVASGRLKLREIELAGGGRARELIAYRRADDAGSRWSDYHRVALDSETAIEIAAALNSSLGVTVAIRKRRQVGVWRHTRIHLDNVEDLGWFVELETVTQAGELEHDLREEHEQAILRLGLNTMPVVAGSYSDLAKDGSTSPFENAREKGTAS